MENIQMNNDNKLCFNNEEIDEELKWVIFEFIAGANHGYLQDEFSKLMDNYNRIYKYIKDNNKS